MTDDINERREDTSFDHYYTIKTVLQNEGLNRWRHQSNISAEVG
jgi:hypothetical protein